MGSMLARADSVSLVPLLAESSSGQVPGVCLWPGGGVTPVSLATSPSDFLQGGELGFSPAAGALMGVTMAAKGRGVKGRVRLGLTFHGGSGLRDGGVLGQGGGRLG